MNSCREAGQQPLPVSPFWHSAALSRYLGKGRVSKLCGAGQNPAGLDGEPGATLLSQHNPAGPSSFFFFLSVMPERIELHFLRKTTPQATAGSILPDFTSIPEIKLSLSPWAVYFLPALSTLPLCAGPEQFLTFCKVSMQGVFLGPEKHIECHWEEALLAALPYFTPSKLSAHMNSFECCRSSAALWVIAES